MQLRKRKISFWGIIVIAIVVLSLIAVYTQYNSNLSGYTGKGIKEQETTTEKKNIPLDRKINDEHSYSIGVPSEWVKVIKDGYDTYIHSPSSTSLQIQTLKFNPAVLTLNADNMNQELAADNCQLKNFEWYDNSTYLTAYEKLTSTPYTYVETTYFDKENMIRLVMSTPTKYYTQFQDTFSAIIDSFKWDKSNPFPSELSLCYSSFGNFIYSYPTGWETGTSDNAVIAQNAELNATMGISAVESQTSYKGVTKVQYSQFASQSRPNFILQQFNANDNIIYAQASYMSNNVQYIMTQYLVTNGKYEYTLTFEVPADNFPKISELIKSCIDTFKYY